MDGEIQTPPYDKEAIEKGLEGTKTARTEALIWIRNSRVCSNRGGLIRKYGVWEHLQIDSSFLGWTN